MERLSKPLRSEIDLHPRFDAVLVHAYPISRYEIEGSVKFKGGLRAKLATRAAGLLYNKGRSIDRIVLLAGAINGGSFPSAAEVMEERLVKRCKVPRGKIISFPEAWDTEGEATTFLQLSRQYNWINVADIAFEKHYKSIQRSLPEGTTDGIRVSYRSVENIIMQYEDDYRVRDLVQRFKKSKYEKGFRLYEFGKDVVAKIPGGKKKLHDLAVRTRVKKDPTLFTRVTQHAIDLFKD
jgi:hypothetical protein